MLSHCGYKICGKEENVIYLRKGMNILKYLARRAAAYTDDLTMKFLLYYLKMIYSVPTEGIFKNIMFLF